MGTHPMRQKRQFCVWLPPPWLGRYDQPNLYEGMRAHQLERWCDIGIVGDNHNLVDFTNDCIMVDLQS